MLNHRNFGNKIKRLSIILMSIVLILAYGFYYCFYDLDRIPKGVEIGNVTSPKGTYTVTAYRSNGGATTSYAVLGVLKVNKTQGYSKNIYWHYREGEATIKWIDEDTVVINGHQLNVPTDTFDFRRSSSE